MPTTLTNGIQLPDKGSVDWYSSMQSNYNLIDTHLGNTDTHVTAEDKANWNSKQGSLSQAQLDAIAQVATNTNDIATLQSGKANASHTHSSSDITDIGDYATKDYVDNSISGLVDNAPAALDTLKELSTALNDDANFASTVTTALSAKADSADLATVATSGDYDDLSNKPSIPTNTSDLNNDSGFVTLNDFDIPSKTSDLTNDSGFITSSDVPTGTSDLINDSNFVDTSNSAVASGITSAKVTSYDSHIADTDIHVTASDKTTWNAVSSKANDSDVVHKSGDETVNGIKNFKNMIPIDGDYLGNEASINQRTNICLRSNRDTADKSCAYISRFRQNKPQGALQTGDLQMICFDVLENEVRTNNVFSIQCNGWVDNVPTKVKFLSTIGDSTFGSSTRPSKINDLNPSSLGMPDLANGVDISSYITHLDKAVNSYTPSVNGWLSIRVKKTSLAHISLMIYQTGGLLSSCETTEFIISGTNLPVIANQNVEIYIIADVLVSAKFYPCQGNV